MAYGDDNNKNDKNVRYAILPHKQKKIQCFSRPFYFSRSIYIVM